MAKLTFNELRKKFGFTAKRTKAYRVLDEFGANITSRVKVMTMAGGLFALMNLASTLLIKLNSSVYNGKKTAA